MTNYEKLINTLKEVFMLDKAELDFGIYRIMNQKRKDIEQFLEKDLVPQVQKVLSDSLSVDKQALQKELNEAIKSALALGADPESLPKVQQLKLRLGEAADMVAIENEVFSLLANFFKRYFDNGDFISMRRYKKDVYAIPYEGEEVKLHWANADQYYIKTSEYFKNYCFKLSNGKSVSFELVEASTEQNNNKTQGDKERRFVIYSEKPYETVGDEFKIYFTYEPGDKKIKQTDLLSDAFNIIKNKVPQEFLELLSLRPTEKDKQRTLLQKHLLDYTARNTFDYFIHKDLEGFLCRELDFYIKNEVLFIDDLNIRDEQEFLKQLSKIKAIKKIGEKIITFLAQIENFQKKLWLKKKMIVECNYCITLDRIPKELYTEILNNQPQIQEWIKLFAIDEIKAQKANKIFEKDINGFTNPLTIEFLNQNQFLVLDTVFFPDTFKWKLIASIEKFDKQCDGLLINSENFQALNVLKNRYYKSLDACYIDPPYNTDASPIMYKNGYRSSSWISLMDSRLKLSKEIISEKGILCTTIDDFQTNELVLLLHDTFGIDNILGTVAIRNNPSGRPSPEGFSISHEYGHFVRMTDQAKLLKFERNEQQNKRYKEEDENGKYMWELLRKRGTDSERKDSPKAYYPFYYDPTNKNVRIPEMTWDEGARNWNIHEVPLGNELEVFPVDENGIERRWRWGIDTARKSMTELKFEKDNINITVYYKYYEPEGVLSSTNWIDSKYSATEHGTGLLKHYFNEYNPFSFPKSIYAVEDALLISGMKKGNSSCIDYFAGSGTTGHAVINLNREDGGRRKYILVEMGAYFDTVTKPRIQKVVYSKNWKDGKPVSREGISHCFKYMRIESYEDTLNNLVLSQTETQQKVLELNPGFKEGYMLNYMLDVETQGSLLNLEWFVNPFNCYLNVTLNNELQPTKVDLIETFNYLIGLVVESYAVPKEGYIVVTGKNLAGEKILVVWRNCTQHNSIALNIFLEKSKYNPLDNEYDRIYVNGDNNVENLKIGDERWKVVLIEEEFKKRMFEY